MKELQADPNAAAMILARLQDGETLLGLVKVWKLPRHAFLSWIASNGELTEQCKRVRELAGIELRMEGLDIVDGGAPTQAVDPDGRPLVDEFGKPVLVTPDVQRDKIRADYREKLSRDLNKPLFGKYTQHDHVHRFDLGERLRRARDRADGVLDAELLPAIEVKQEPSVAVAVEAATDAVVIQPPPI